MALRATLRDRAEEDLRGELEGLRPEEAAVLAFLQKRLAKQARDEAEQPDPDSERGLASALAKSLRGRHQRNAARP